MQGRDLIVEIIAALIKAPQRAAFKHARNRVIVDNAIGREGQRDFEQVQR
jgi:hypothetical protein